MADLTLERNLATSATALVGCIDEIIAYIQETGTFSGVLTAPVPLALAVPLQVLWVEYLHAFQCWKKPDEHALVERIKGAVVALTQAELRIPANEPENSPLRVEFKVQTRRLKDKLAEIAGVDALNQFNLELSAIQLAHGETGMGETALMA
jgi:hypothetical protein